VGSGAKETSTRGAQWEQLEVEEAKEFSQMQPFTAVHLSFCFANQVPLARTHEPSNGSNDSLLTVFNIIKVQYSIELVVFSPQQRRRNVACPSLRCSNASSSPRCLSLVLVQCARGPGRPAHSARSSPPASRRPSTARCGQPARRAPSVSARARRPLNKWPPPLAYPNPPSHPFCDNDS